MDIRPITPQYSVTPQIAPQELGQIAAAGYGTVICNRPDDEVPGELKSEVMADEAARHGLTFRVLPLTHQTMTPERTAQQRAWIEESDKPVLAYCASGTRSSVAWALSHAADLGADAVLAATAKAGYQLDGLRPQLESMGSDAEA